MKRIFLDTQILISAIQGNELSDIKGSSISSIVASEFLGAQGKVPSRAKYYIPISGGRHSYLFGIDGASKRDHPFNKNSTDSLMMDFGGQFPTIIHFGNLALADLINNQAVSLFDNAIAHIEKAQRKVFRKKFEFLMECNLDCVPVSRSAVDIAQHLLETFAEQYSFKKDFRNSLNDLLIAATSIESSSSLYTKDDLLTRHIAEYLEASSISMPRGLQVDFSEVAQSSKIKTRESKEFINKGWQISFSRNQKKL